MLPNFPSLLKFFLFQPAEYGGLKSWIFRCHFFYYNKNTYLTVHIIICLCRVFISVSIYRITKHCLHRSIKLPPFFSVKLFDTTLLTNRHTFFGLINDDGFWYDFLDLFGMLIYILNFHMFKIFFYIFCSLIRFKRIFSSYLVCFCLWNLLQFSKWETFDSKSLLFHSVSHLLLLVFCTVCLPKVGLLYLLRILSYYSPLKLYFTLFTDLSVKCFLIYGHRVLCISLRVVEINSPPCTFNFTVTL